jgi:hypothetical protein
MSLNAVTISASQISLSWIDVSNNETGFEIERSMTSGVGFTLVATVPANGNSYADTNLSANTLYVYRVRSINSVGPSTYTSEAAATTLDVPPNVPEALTATTISSTQINLTWSDVSNNENSFQIERSISTLTGFSLIATTLANATTYSDANLAPSTPYFYRVRAVNAGGMSVYSSEASAITLESPPIAPANLTVRPTSSSQIDISWSDMSTNETGFQLERSLASGLNFEIITTTNANLTAYSNIGLTPNTKYFYRVRSINGVGSSVATPEVEATTFPEPPTQPSSLVATSLSSSQINLVWNDLSNNESGFQLERSLTTGMGFILIATVSANSTSYSDAGLIANTPYFYRIRAINSGGISAYSAESVASTMDTPPAAPAMLTATAMSISQINLAWNDASSNENGFQIERSLTSGSGFTVVYTTAANATSYSDIGLTENTKYYYRIRSFNSLGNSTYTSEVNSSTLAIAQPYGQIFNETSFASATRFPIVGTGISRGTDKLVMTGNPTLFSSYVFHDDVANPFRYTCLENWKVRVKVKTPSALNSTSYGIGIGVQSVNTADPYSTIMRWSWDAGANFIYLYQKSTISLQIVSTTKYVPAANTFYWVEVTRIKDSFKYTIFDGATGATQLFAATLTFPTFTPGNYVKAHNTGQFSLHHFGGNNNEVTNWEVSTSALMNADYIGLGDSNMHGMFATGNDQRWIETAMKNAGKSFTILAGIADRTTDVVKRLPEVIALKPKAVVLSIGRNDLANSVPLSTVQINIDYIINTLQASGITVNLAGVIASNVNVSSLQAYYTSKSNVQVNGYSATKSATATTLHSAFNSGDAIHLNQAGNTAMSNLLFGILVPQTPPIAPSSLSVSSVSSSQINLVWSDNSTNETAFQIEQSLTSGSGFTLVATTSPNITSYTVTGLTANTQYFYRIRAINTGGTSAYSPEVNAFSLPIMPPITPSNLSASSFSSSQINLTWTDASDNETGFQIEQSLTTGVGFSLIAPATQNISTYSDTGLSPNTKYFYRIRAINNTSVSTYSLEVSATTSGRRFLVDFGSPSSQTAIIGWNNVTSPTTGSSTSLVESGGGTSSLSLKIVKDPSNGFGAFNTYGNSQAVLDYPISAVSDSHYAWQSGGTYSLNGLDNSKVYGIRMYGSRMSVTDTRKGSFTISGQQQFLEAANNTSQTIVFSNIAPISGSITIDFNVAAGSTFGYINVMDITENSGNSATRIATNPNANIESTSKSETIDSSLEVYPIPTSNEVTIKINDPIQQEATIQIIDLNGKEIINYQGNTNQKNVVDLRSLSAGLYIVRAKLQAKNYTKVLLKQE